MLTKNAVAIRFLSKMYLCMQFSCIETLFKPSKKKFSVEYFFLSESPNHAVEKIDQRMVGLGLPLKITSQTCVLSSNNICQSCPANSC